ncbi:MAG TPA: hypothetical protein VJS90_18920 [Pseudomonas sp.]|uniref:hypothetical protein n=1 Tax=Pseudomonas sp. TaxID=306 RepID=UPI002B45978A|nr:hypothetical protein [Pseudomonas sp.]HKS15109.1 hypothetical protein [Pseudomonas sp.]
MAVFIVTWNLNKERANYDAARRAFLQHLERFDHTKDTGLESVRWISTSWTPDQIQKDLLTKLDNSDRLFISQVTSENHQGWLAQEVWTWINARM